MIRLDVRSTNGRPRASTPVTVSGTASTIRELRRLRSSSPAFIAFSALISIRFAASRLYSESSARSLPNSYTTFYPLLIRSVCSCLAAICFGFIGPCCPARAGKNLPYFFRHPNRTNEQINRSLEKGGMISFQLVPQKQQHPPANKKCAAPDPFHEQERHEPRENQRDANSMQNFVPPG